MRAPIFAYMLVKLASRCNLDCSYCYWFRDKDVYTKPATLTLEAENALLDKLERHVRRYRLDEFTLLLHGGEPLLFGKKRLGALLHKVRDLGERTGCRFVTMLSSNGVLVDPEWAGLFRDFDVHVSISIDGPEDVHNARRTDFAGRGSHAKARRAIEVLRAAGLSPGVIAVCDPKSSPKAIAAYLANDLGVKTFDILPPDATHEDAVDSISDYYTQLFDIWYDELGRSGVEIRVISGILQGLYSGTTSTDSIGYGPVHTVTLLTDGALEALDVLRISQTDVTTTGLSVFRNEIQDVSRNARWRAIFDASLRLPEACRRCQYRVACGGGHLAHRWSKDNGFDNPSVYCEDWKAVFGHVWQRMLPRMAVAHGRGELPLASALARSEGRA